MEPMYSIDMIRAAQSRPLSDEDGEPIDLVLLPGLDDDAIRRFAAALPVFAYQQKKGYVRRLFGG